MILQTIANQPALWQKLLRAPRAGDDKYRRGTVLIHGGAMAGATMLAEDLPPSIAMVMGEIMK